MFKKIKASDLLLVVMLLVVIALTAHFTLIDRMGFWRLVYPLQAKMAIWSMECNKHSPAWMTEVLKKTILEHGTLGNQLTYIDAKHNMYECTSGWRRTSVLSERITPKDRFRYASVTKLFTADAILDLVNQKKISLSTKLVDVLAIRPPFKDERVAQITIADLLSHQSGFDRMRSEDIMFKYNQQPWCPHRLNEINKQQLDFNPAQRTSYDNRNYCLLGAVIEKITGQKYRIWMDTHYQLESIGIRFIDGSYLQDEVRYDFRNVYYYYPDYYKNLDFFALSSSAGLSGTASALAVKIQALLNRSPLNMLSGDKNQPCEKFDLNSCYGYAFNFTSKKDKQREMYFRVGYLPASSSLVAVDDCLGVIVWLGNGGQRVANQDEEYMSRLIYDTVYSIPKKKC